MPLLFKINLKKNMIRLKYNPKQRKGAIIFGLIIAAIFGGLGAYIVFSVYPGKMDEKNRVSAIPVMDLTRFNALDTGGEGVAFGYLANNDILDKGDLVAYCIDRWDVDVEDDGEIEGSWVREKEIWPSLTIAIDGGQLRMSPGVPQRLMGLRHESVKPSNLVPAAEYEGQQLGHGSLRTLGAKNRDQVTVVGAKIGQQAVEAEYFYIGTREELLKSLVFSARVFLVMGIIVMVVGIVIAVAVTRKD